MKTSSAVLAGVCLIAATALAQPKEPITKDNCRPGPRCGPGDVLSKGQCCERIAPEPVKKAPRTEKAVEPVSPIEGFALADIHAFEVGELQTSCVVDRKRGTLTMKAKVLPAKSGGVYGGCCFEHTEALPMNADATAAASLYISPDEELVHVALEQSSGVRQSYLHNGPLGIGSHQLTSERLGLPEVRRLCVAVFGSPAAVAHDASLTITRVTFEQGAGDNRSADRRF